MQNPKTILKKPCSENWFNMNPIEKGRFCNRCKKQVVDFTKMNNEDIENYLIQESQEICGHFNSIQVILIRPKHHQFLIKWFNKLNSSNNKRITRKIYISFILLCMSIVGCNVPSTKSTGEIDNQTSIDSASNTDTVDVVHKNNERHKNDNILLGKIESPRKKID